MSAQSLPTPHAKPMGTIRSAAIFARSIMLDLGHKVVRQRKRSRDQVHSDYAEGEWSQQNAARNWTRSPTLQIYVDKAWTEREITTLVDRRLWQMPSSEYYAMRRKRVADLLDRHGDGSGRIIELGSGTGTNLFALSLDARFGELLGLELSSSGLAVARTVANHYGVADRVRFEAIDLLDSASPGFDQIAGATVFTHYCLEQLPNDTERVFQNLIKAGIRRAIMIEPSFELLKPSSLRDLCSMTYVLRQDYQRTIVKVANKLVAEGKIRIVTLDRLNFASSWRNAPTLLVWEPL